MTFRCIHQFKSKRSQTSSSTALFTPRPFSVQKSNHSSTQDEIENVAFNQHKFEAFGLQLKETHGTITPVEQARLGVLQAKMDDLWAQRLNQAKKQPNVLENLTHNTSTTQTPTPEVSVQPKFLPEHRDATSDRSAPSIEPQPNQTGMPDALKAGVENLSGYSLDHVKVHYNSPKPAQLQALAYTQGTDIHVAPGQENYLPHEAWHVVQQMQGRVKPTLQMKDTQINHELSLEREADVMGAKALASAMPQSSTTRVLRSGQFSALQSPSLEPGALLQAQSNVIQMASNRLYVGNLSLNTSSETLEAAFAAVGEVRDVHLVTDRETGQSRGFGFVTMDTSQSANNAIAQLNGVMLDGKPLRVNEAQERTAQGGGGSAGRSGSGGRGGGRGGSGGRGRY